MHAPEPAHPHLPAWLRRTRGEHRWPAALAVVVAIRLQLVLPDRMVPLTTRRPRHHNGPADQNPPAPPTLSADQTRPPGQARP